MATFGRTRKASWPQTSGRAPNLAETGDGYQIWETVSEGSPISPRSPPRGNWPGTWPVRDGVLTKGPATRPGCDLHQRARVGAVHGWDASGVRTGAGCCLTIAKCGDAPAPLSAANLEVAK